MSINITDELHASTTKGKIASAKEVFLTGDTENLQQIGEKTHQLEDSIKKIAATGGASTAAAVTFDNANSQLTAVNVQSAVDELQVSKIDKTSIVQESGNAKDKVMSQKAITDWVNKGYQYRGIATPDTNPGIPNRPVFYIALESGTYNNFGDIQVIDISIISGSNNTWKIQELHNFKYSDFLGKKTIPISCLLTGLYIRKIEGTDTYVKSTSKTCMALVKRYTGDGITYSNNIGVYHVDKLPKLGDSPNYIRISEGKHQIWYDVINFSDITRVNDFFVNVNDSARVFALEDYIKDTTDLFVKKSRYVNLAGSETGTLETYCCTDFIPITFIKDKLVYVGNRGSSTSELSVLNFYDKDKKPISHYDVGTHEKELTFELSVSDFPAGTYYIRCSSYVYSYYYLGGIYSIDIIDKNTYLANKSLRISENIQSNTLSARNLDTLSVAYTDKYIDKDTGNLIDANTYKVYRPIYMKRGEKLHVVTAYSTSKGAILSEYLDNGTYKPLIPSAGTSNDIEYTADRDIAIVISTYLLGNDRYNATYYYLTIDDLVKKQTNFEKSYSPLWNSMKQGIIKVAYSQTGLIINTREQFLSASILGYDAQKADMELTSDGEIVMCHDGGITFDEDGRSVSFNTENNSSIIGMTKEEFCNIEYADSSIGGYHHKHTDLESFLKICKKTKIIPYLTLRNKNVTETLSVLVRTLRKYDLQDRCIISSFPPSFSNIAQAKELLPNAVFIYVNSYGTPLSEDIIDKCAKIGHVIPQIESKENLIEASKNAIAYANEKEVPWGAYDIMDGAVYQKVVSMGCSIMQIYSPAFNETKRNCLNFFINLNDNEATIAPPFLRNTKGLLDADITISENRKTLSISNIRYTNSGNDFADALLNEWMQFMPMRIYATGCNITSATIDSHNYRIELSSEIEIPTNGRISVMIDF